MRRERQFPSARVSSVTSWASQPRIGRCRREDLRLMAQSRSMRKAIPDQSMLWLRPVQNSATRIVFRSGGILGAILLLTAMSCSIAQAQSCSVSTASGSYGNVGILSGAAADTTSTFTVTCTGKKNNIVRLCLEMAAGTPTDAGKRALSNGAKYLDHEFYSDASRTQVWGSWGAVVPSYGSGGVTQDLTLDSSGNGSQTFTLYARVLANQSAAAPLTYSWSATSPGL